MLKIMKLWNGKTFLFHSSQEVELLQKELSARIVLLKSSCFGVTEYQNKDIPTLWAQTMPYFKMGENYADK